MISKIEELLLRIISLLRDCGWESKAEWFDEKREVLRKSRSDPDDFKKALDELDNALAGMGGFADLPLTPKTRDMTVQGARDRQWQLAADLGEAIDQLKNQ